MATHMDSEQLKSGENCCQTLVYFALLISGCTESQPPLNSDRIRAQFGSYGVRIVEADEALRLSCLYSESPAGDTCRTVARVEIRQPVPADLSELHSAITAGASIGEVFRSAGYSIRKRRLFVGGRPVPPPDRDLFESLDIAPVGELATHRYVFEVHRKNANYDYAIITEIHHPDYLTVEQLRALYPELR